MKCNCKDIIVQSQECYDQMVCFEIPAHMNSYKEARLKAGLSSGVCIDPCIVDEIQYLWSLGVITYGSCCGHNKLEPMVNVDDKNIEQMLNLGYVQNHPDPKRKDTFKLKIKSNKWRKS